MGGGGYLYIFLSPLRRRRPDRADLHPLRDHGEEHQNHAGKWIPIGHHVVVFLCLWTLVDISQHFLLSNFSNLSKDLERFHIFGKDNS